MRIASFVQPSRRAFQETTEGRKHRPDYLLLVLMCALLLCGAVVVYAIGPGLTNGTKLDSNYYSSKQLIAIVLGFIGFGIAVVTPIRKWAAFQPFIICLAIIAAFAVRVIGTDVNGAHRWIQFAGMSFQVAELIKLALVLGLARYLSERKKQGLITDPSTFKHLGILIVAIVLIVAGMQSDLGSASVMMAIVGVLSFIAGLPMRKLIIGGGVLVILVAFAIILTPYRRDRVATFLNPTADCKVDGYQVCQALITVGSGGLFGKGVGHSVQAYGYLPKPENDSIFAVVSEKFGFVGAALMVGVFWLLFRRLMIIVRSTGDEYTSFIVMGVLVWLSVQMAINVGAMIGLLPLKGITLPFVSYGGTSIIFVMVAMGLVFQASKYTDFSLAKSSRVQPTTYDAPRRLKRV